MPQIPDFIAPTRHTDPADALAQIQRIYQQQIGHLRAAMQRFVAGDTPPAPVRAFYPFVRVHTTTVARADNKLAYGFVEGPGRDIVEAQANYWFVFTQPLAFFIFIVAGVAVTHRHPFDQPEAEQELAEGYHVEYSGMKWGMFFVGEYVNVVLISALLTTLFFGGWLPPFGIEIPFVPAAFWFIMKTSFFVMLFVLARGSLMRPRYDQVMNFGWKVCLPLALVNLLITAAVVLWQTPTA